MKKLTDKLYVRPQVAAEDIRSAKANGFATIINNRPDDEERGQPSAADNRAVAVAEGMGYTHIPVVPGQIIETQIRAFQDALSKTDGPVLAHCKTGIRSATLYVLGEVLDGRMRKDEVAPLGTRLGLDLTGAVKWLEMHARLTGKPSTLI